MLILIFKDLKNLKIYTYFDYGKQNNRNTKRNS